MDHTHPTMPGARPESSHGVITTATVPERACRSLLGTYAECPLCGGDLRPEHAHFKCAACGWRDSCCD